MLPNWQTRLLFTILSLLLLLATGCQGQQADSFAGRIMIWHSWGDEGTALLESLVAQYQAVQTDAVIVVVALSPDEIFDRFSNTASLGLGPDLVIGDNSWLASLVEAGAISPIDTEPLDTGQYDSNALELSSINGSLYALPVTLQTPALYYNKALTENAPASYDAILEQAEAGERVAISVRAQDAFGGIGAFGPNLLNNEDGVQVLVLEGFVQWLSWLKVAQENANVVLSQDEPSLVRLLADGEVTYFIGSFDARETLMAAETAVPDETQRAAAQGTDFDLGIAPLPRGSDNLSRAALEAELLYFNAASSRRQRTLALEFATFITNSEQSSTYLRDLSFVPANREVRVNSVIYPLVQPYTQTGRNAIALPLSLEPFLLGPQGDVVYTAVLSGVVEPKQAVCDWFIGVKDAFGTSVDDGGYCTN